MNPISQGLNNISTAVGNISTNVSQYVSNKKLEQSRDARISLYPSPPVSNAGLGGKIINGVFGVTVAPLMLPGHAPLAAYKNHLLTKMENKFTQLIDLPESQRKDVVALMMKLPKEERKDLLQQMRRLPESDLKDIVEFAITLPKNNWSDGLRLMLNLPKAEREAVLERVSLLPQSKQGVGAVIMMKLSESERKDSLEFMRELPESGEKFFEFICKLNGPEGIDLVKFMMKLPESERKDVYEFTRLLEGADNGYRLCDVVKTSEKFLKDVPQDKRREFIEFVSTKLSEDMNFGVRMGIAGAIASVEEAQWPTFFEIVDSVCEGQGGVQKGDFIKALGDVPQSERSNLLAYILKPGSDPKISLDVFSHLILNPVLKDSLLKPEHREALLKFCEAQMSNGETSKLDLENFVYANYVALGLAEDHILLQKTFLSLPVGFGEIKLTVLDSQDLNRTDAKTADVVKKQMELWNIKKSEGAKIEKTKIGSLGSEVKETIELRSANITEQESIAFQNALGEYENPGKLGKILVFNKLNVGSIVLENGNTLYPGEQTAIKLYTSQHYLLINGTLDNDQTSIKQWESLYGQKKREEAQGHVMQIAEVAISGINKLPPYEGLLYRGAALSNEKLEEYRQGTVMMSKKFLSCSTKADVCEKFAKDSAKEYRNHTKEDHKAVLFVFKSETAKNISLYSELENEEERVYPPGQGFRSVNVDEKTIPGLAIIYMEELK